MFKVEKIAGAYGGPFGKLAGITVNPEILSRLGDCLVDTLAEESRKDFAKRGWSGKDPKGGPPVWDSFDYRIRGTNTLEITTTFWGLFELATGDIPSRKMTWLTQEAKDNHPENYPRTPTERRLRMKQAGRVSEGERMPLVVPLKTRSGEVIFRTAPFETQDAWVHPGIAKFTFIQRAMKKGREKLAEIIQNEVVQVLKEG